MSEALRGGRWIMDLKHNDYNTIVLQVVQLAREIREAHLNLNSEAADEIRWTLSSSGDYTAKSAYAAHFTELPATTFRSTIWKIWARGR